MQTGKIDAVAPNLWRPLLRSALNATNRASRQRAGRCCQRECTTAARISRNESRPRSCLRIPSPRRATGQYGIEQRRGLEIARAQIRVEGDLHRQLAVGYGPFSWRGREPIRETVLTASFEDAHECAAKACRVQHHELLHEDKIDKILCATARPTLSVSPGVCVHLLRDVLFERQDRHFDRFDAGECQKIRSANWLGPPFQRV